MLDKLYWYQQLPELFRAEEEVLKNGLPFFRYVDQLPTEITRGELHIRGELAYGEGKKQLIEIAFPHSYPDAPPEVFPLLGTLTANGIQLQQIMTPAGPVIVKPFNRGNQYANGKICLFRDEDVWQPYVTGVAMALTQ